VINQEGANAMKNTKKTFKVLSILVICLLLISACSPKQKLIGKWQNEQSGEILEFFKDGTISMTTLGMSFTGSYSILDDTNLKITISGLLGIGGSQIYEYSVSGDTLTLTIYGIASQYTKAK
jgi:hypothetical protein